MTRFKTAAAALVLGAFAAPAMVNAQALQSFTGGSLFATFEADGDTIGWSFTVNRQVIVTHLGYWDGDSATATLASDKPVGLWNSAGVLLTSNTVTTTSPFTGAWRYEPATNVTLDPGTTYSLGAFVEAANVNASGYMSGTTSRTLAAGFVGVNSLRDPSGPQTGLVFPSVTGAFTGRFGPNLLFTEVPEPSAAAALLGPAVLVLRRRRHA